MTMPVPAPDTPDAPLVLPAAPLLAAVQARGGLRACGVRREETPGAERLTKAYYRAVQRGWLNCFVADELAVAVLGLHPAAVWGDAWFRAQTPDSQDAAGDRDRDRDRGGSSPAAVPAGADPQRSDHEPSWLDAALAVLDGAGPLNHREITRRVLARRLKTSWAGKTPAQTVKARLYTAVRRGDSRLRMVAPGVFERAG